MLTGIHRRVVIRVLTVLNQLQRLCRDHSCRHWQKSITILRILILLFFIYALVFAASGFQGEYLSITRFQLSATYMYANGRDRSRRVQISKSRTTHINFENIIFDRGSSILVSYMDFCMWSIYTNSYNT